MTDGTTWRVDRDEVGATLTIESGGVAEPFLIPASANGARFAMLDRVLEAHPDLRAQRSAIEARLAGEILIESDDYTVRGAWHGAKLRVVAERAGQPIHVGTLDPTSKGARDRLIGELRDAGVRVDIREQVRGALLAAAAEPRPAPATAPAPHATSSAPFATDCEPWSEPVDGAELLDELAHTFRHFCVLPDHGDELLALWCAHTWTFETSSVSPRLLVVSPTMRSGKTVVLTVLGAVARRALLAANLTAAVLFRAIDTMRPTLLVDEADTFLVGPTANPELVGVLNAGYLASGSVLRCNADTHAVEAFACFGPVAIALIERSGAALRDTLTDRGIALRLRRKTSDERVARLSIARVGAELEPIRRRCLRWATDHAGALQDADARGREPIGLGSDRAEDLWLPLLAIAASASAEWLDRATAAALVLSGRRPDGEDADAACMLLADLHDMFAERRVDRLTTVDVADALRRLEDRPWSEWRRGDPINGRGIARLLKPFGITPRALRVGAGTHRGYERADFADAWRRYLDHGETALASGSL